MGRTNSELHADKVPTLYTEILLYEYSVYNALCGVGYAQKHIKFVEGTLDYGFMCACAGGNIKMVKYLMAKGANNYNYGLCYACRLLDI